MSKILPLAELRLNSPTGDAQPPAHRLMRDLQGHALPATPARPLTLTDLRALARIGHPELARFIAAGACQECGHSRASSFHREACNHMQSPVEAPMPVRQPWEPRPARAA